MSLIKNQKNMIEDSKKPIRTTGFTLFNSTNHANDSTRETSEVENHETEKLTEGKQYNKVRDMILPYNSFFGISNDLKCFANKQDHLPLETLL